MKKHPEARLSFVEEDDDLVLYCEIKRDGHFMRIAKRYSGKDWFSLEPGYVVRGGTPGTDCRTIRIEYHPANAGMQ
jgi:hypothetical protein